MNSNPSNPSILKRKVPPSQAQAQEEEEEYEPACIKKRYQGQLSLRHSDTNPHLKEQTMMRDETEEEYLIQKEVLPPPVTNLPTAAERQDPQQLFIYNNEHQNYLKIVFNRRKWGELLKKNCQRLYEYLEKNIDDQYYMAMRLYSEHSRIEGMPMFAWMTLMYYQFWLKKKSTQQMEAAEGAIPTSRLELNEELLSRYEFPSSAVGTNYRPLSISFTWRLATDNNNLLQCKKKIIESCNSDNYQDFPTSDVGKVIFQNLNEMLRRSTLKDDEGSPLRKEEEEEEPVDALLEHETFISFLFEKSHLQSQSSGTTNDEGSTTNNIKMTKIVKEPPLESVQNTTTEIILILIFKKPQLNLEYCYGLENQISCQVCKNLRENVDLDKQETYFSTHFDDLDDDDEVEEEEEVWSHHLNLKNKMKGGLKAYSFVPNPQKTNNGGRGGNKKQKSQKKYTKNLLNNTQVCKNHVHKLQPNIENLRKSICKSLAKKIQIYQLGERAGQQKQRQRRPSYVSNNSSSSEGDSSALRRRSYDYGLYSYEGGDEEDDETLTLLLQSSYSDVSSKPHTLLFRQLFPDHPAEILKTISTPQVWIHDAAFGCDTLLHEWMISFLSTALHSRLKRFCLETLTSHTGKISDTSTTKRFQSSDIDEEGHLGGDGTTPEEEYDDDDEDEEEEELSSSEWPLRHSLKKNAHQKKKKKKKPYITEKRYPSKNLAKIFTYSQLLETEFIPELEVKIQSKFEDPREAYHAASSSIYVYIISRILQQHSDTTLLASTQRLCDINFETMIKPLNISKEVDTYIESKFAKTFSEFRSHSSSKSQSGKEDLLLHRREWEEFLQKHFWERKYQALFANKRGYKIILYGYIVGGGSDISSLLSETSAGMAAAANKKGTQKQLSWGTSTTKGGAKKEKRISSPNEILPVMITLNNNESRLLVDEEIDSSSSSCITHSLNNNSITKTQFKCDFGRSPGALLLSKKNVDQVAQPSLSRNISSSPSENLLSNIKKDDPITPPTKRGSSSAAGFERKYNSSLSSSTTHNNSAYTTTTTNQQQQSSSSSSSSRDPENQLSESLIKFLIEKSKGELTEDLIRKTGKNIIMFALYNGYTTPEELEIFAGQDSTFTFYYIQQQVNAKKAYTYYLQTRFIPKTKSQCWLEFSNKIEEKYADVLKAFRGLGPDGSSPIEREFYKINYHWFLKYHFYLAEWISLMFFSEAGESTKRPGYYMGGDASTFKTTFVTQFLFLFLRVVKLSLEKKFHLEATDNDILFPHIIFADECPDLKTETNFTKSNGFGRQLLLKLFEIHGISRSLFIEKKGGALRIGGEPAVLAASNFEPPENSGPNGKALCSRFHNLGVDKTKFKMLTPYAIYPLPIKSLMGTKKIDFEKVYNRNCDCVYKDATEVTTNDNYLDLIYLSPSSSSSLESGSHSPPRHSHISAGGGGELEEELTGEYIEDDEEAHFGGGKSIVGEEEDFKAAGKISERRGTPLLVEDEEEEEDEPSNPNLNHSQMKKDTPTLAINNKEPSFITADKLLFQNKKSPTTTNNKSSTPLSTNKPSPQKNNPFLSKDIIMQRKKKNPTTVGVGETTTNTTNSKSPPFHPLRNKSGDNRTPPPSSPSSPTRGKKKQRVRIPGQNCTSLHKDSNLYNFWCVEHRNEITPELSCYLIWKYFLFKYIQASWCHSLEKCDQMIPLRMEIQENIYKENFETFIQLGIKTKLVMSWSALIRDTKALPNIEDCLNFYDHNGYFDFISWLKQMFSQQENNADMKEDSSVPPPPTSSSQTQTQNHIIGRDPDHSRSSSWSSGSAAEKRSLISFGDLNNSSSRFEMVGKKLTKHEASIISRLDSTGRAILNQKGIKLAYLWMLAGGGEQDILLSSKHIERGGK